MVPVSLLVFDQYYYLQMKSSHALCMQSEMLGLLLFLKLLSLKHVPSEQAPMICHFWKSLISPTVRTKHKRRITDRDFTVLLIP